MDIKARIDSILNKDETYGYVEREAAIDGFNAHNTNPVQAERYVEALEYILPRLSTPIYDGDILLGRMTEGPLPCSLDEARERVRPNSELSPFCVLYYRTPGHCSLDYGILIEKGLSGIADMMAARARTPAQRAYAALAARAAQAIHAFSLRWAAAARALGMEEAARAAEAVPYRPAANLREALQGVWMMEMILSCIVGARDFAYSRLDLALNALYEEADKAEAALLLRDFLLKNNEIGGMSSELNDYMPVPCHATNIYMMLGGRGAEQCVDLDIAILEAARDVALPQPVLALRMEKDSPRRWKLAAAEAAMSLNGQASLYNDDALITNLRGLGYTDEQALNYTMSGCNRAEFTGHQSSDCFHNCPQWLLEAFYDDNVSDMDSLLDALGRAARGHIAMITGNRRVPQDEALRFSLESLLMRGCAEQVCDLENGGLSTETVVHNLCGMATVADSLAAIHDIVFERQLMTLDEYRTLVKNGFEGDTAALTRARIHAPKYGNDDPRADQWVRKAGEILANAVREHGGSRIHIPSFYGLWMHHRMGRQTGATPDGRCAGEPISENQSAVYGCDREGVTAMLRSAAALPQHLCGAGGLSLRFARPVDTEILLAMTETYFAMGGVNLAPYCVSRETLLDARARPEQYQSLFVRIVGYSEVYLRMPEHIQLELLERSEYTA